MYQQKTISLNIQHFGTYKRPQNLLMIINFDM